MIRCIDFFFTAESGRSNTNLNCPCYVYFTLDDRRFFENIFVYHIHSFVFFFEFERHHIHARFYFCCVEFGYNINNNNH